MQDPQETAAGTGNASRDSREPSQPERIYVFKSQKTAELRAFAGDLEGSRLPGAHGPWTAIGSVAPHMDLPHRMPRPAVERAIATTGFQLWRLKPAKQG